MVDDQALTTEQAAEMSGVSIATVQRWIKDRDLPAVSAPAVGKGRPSRLIKKSDLVAFNQRRLGGGNASVTPTMMLTDEDRRVDALSLAVIWPDRGETRPFTTELFDGYSDFRAVTYTASMDTIMGLLLKYPFEKVEVIFGSLDLLHGDKINPIVAQKAIEDSISQCWIGLGGDTDPMTRKLLEHQQSGRLRLLAMSPGVVHSKYYLLEGEAGRRVMVGSANLSERAFSGKQGEILLAYDNHDFIWQEIERKYRALAVLSEKSELTLRKEIKKAELVSSKDLPIMAKVKEGHPVEIFMPASAPEAARVDADTPYLGVRAENLTAVLGATLATNLKPDKNGVVQVTPAVVRRVDRARESLALAHTVKSPNRLDIVGGRFIYNGEAVLTTPDSESVALDAWLITEYFNKMGALGPGAATMQRNYFGFMGWFFFSPFMSRVRHERVGESPTNSDFKLLALIYGPANAVKSGLVSFLQSAMFGDGSSYSDKGNMRFTPTDVKKLRGLRGALPIFFDDIAGTRFANTRGGETAGETIAKDYDRATNDGNEYYPCLAVAMNADAQEFSTQVRKRCLMVYANQCVAEDDSALKARLDIEVQPLHNRISTAFYAEYLERMGERLGKIKPGEWMGFDYLWESTNLILELLLEHKKPDEDRPRWAKPVGWREYDDAAWELKRKQLKIQLSEGTLTREFPPPRGLWTLRENVIYVGVDDYRTAEKSNEFPSQILEPAARFGGALRLNKDATVAMLRRGDGDYQLPDFPPEPPPAPVIPAPPPPPEPPPPPARRPGLLTRLKQALKP